MIKKLFSIFLTTVLAPIVSAQQFPDQPAGIVPYGSYSVADFDAVDLSSGTVILNIPLLSYPQKGSLPPLTLSLAYAPPIYDSQCQAAYTGEYPFTTCTPIHYEPVPFGSGTNPYYGPIGIGLVESPALHIFEDYNDGNGGIGVGPTYASIHVTDASGATHVMGQTSSTTMNSIDATGLAIDNAYWSGEFSTIFNGDVVIDRNGIKYTEPTGYFSPGLFPRSGTIADPNGNTITGGAAYITDSVGRSIPTAGIANLGIPYESGMSTPGSASCVTNTYPGIGTVSGNIDLVFCYSAYSLSYPVYPGYGPYDMEEWDATAYLLHTVTLPDGKQWVFDYNSFGGVNSITTPAGATMTYGYAWAGATGGFGCALDSTMEQRVVTRTLNLNDGVTPPYVWTYSQGTLTITDYVASIDVIVNDPNGNDTVHHFTCPFETETRYYQGLSTASTPVLLKTVETDTGSSRDFGEGNPFGYNDLAGGPYNIVKKTVITTLNPGTASARTSATYYCYDNDYSRSTDPYKDYCTTSTGATFYDLNTSFGGSGHPLLRGSVTAQIDFDYGGSGIGSPLTITRTDYKWLDDSTYAVAGVNLIGIPSSMKTYDGSSVQKAETDYTYDESGYLYSSGKFGKATTVVQGLSGETATTHTHYNSDGLPSETDDANTNPTYLTYQCYGSLPNVKTDALGHATTYGYDCNTGLLTSVQDPNDAATGRAGTLYHYDSMKDLYSTTYPDGGSVTVDYHSYATPLNVTVTTSADPDPAIVTSTQYDTLVRPAVTTAANGATSETTYDGLNQVLSVSNPHFSGATDGYTTYAYDGIGRKFLQCNQDNGTGSSACTAGTSYQQWSYAGNITTFQDEVGNSWARTSDGLGRLVNVVEPGSLSTTYTYSALGDLTYVNQIGNGSTDTSRTRSFTYDSLSRLICGSNPETNPYNSTNPCPASSSSTLPSGVTSYSYYANGNLHTKTDARSATTTFNYDALNRITSKTYSIGTGSTAAATPTTCYVYDTNPGSGSDGNFLGRLTQEGTVFGTCPTSLAASGFLTLKTILGYDPMGRVKRQQQCQLASCSTSSPFNSSTDYDLAGNETTYTNSVHSIVLTNNYDAAGHLLNLSSSWADGTHPAALFSGGTYGPSGALTGAIFGTSLNMTRAYDNRLRVAWETVTHP